MVVPSLTLRQRQILDFIQAYSLAQGCSPTHRDIAEAFGFSSYGTVHRHLKELRRRGYLDRERNKTRGLRLEPVAEDASSLPLLGKVAAGGMVETFPASERVPVPPPMQMAARRRFALTIEGESMSDAGILPGDVVIIDADRTARTGDIVVARVENETTVKRLRVLEGGEAILEPENPDFKPIQVRLSQLSIQGVVVGLLRSYEPAPATARM